MPKSKQPLKTSSKNKLYIYKLGSVFVFSQKSLHVGHVGKLLKVFVPRKGYLLHDSV